MKAVSNTIAIVCAVFLLADAICNGEFAPFSKGFMACGLVMGFVEELE